MYTVQVIQHGMYEIYFLIIETKAITASPKIYYYFVSTIIKYNRICFNTTTFSVSMKFHWYIMLNECQRTGKCLRILFLTILCDMQFYKTWHGTQQMEIGCVTNLTWSQGIKPITFSSRGECTTTIPPKPHDNNT